MEHRSNGAFHSGRSGHRREGHAYRASEAERTALDRACGREVAAVAEWWSAWRGAPGSCAIPTNCLHLGLGALCQSLCVIDRMVPDLRRL